MSGAQALLVGLPGSGKTTIAAGVASQLGCPHVELDQEIERIAGMTVSQIFVGLGEAAFRRFEVEATRALLDRPPSIVSTGGGWIANARARALVPPTWRTIYLRVSAPTAAARLGGATEGRPLLADAGAAGRLRERLEELAAERVRLYERADTTIDTEAMSLPEVIDRTAELVSAFLYG